MVVVIEEDWSLSAVPRGYWHAGTPPTGSLVVITADARLILTRYATLSIHARRARAGSPAARFMTVTGFERIEVGEPWTYRRRDEDLITEEVTAPVEEIWEVAGAFASMMGAPIDDSSVRRTSEQEVFVAEELGPGTTVLISTIGGWDGTWILSGDRAPQRFVPDDRSEPMRSWDMLITNAWARVGQTLFLAKRIAPGVWGKVDPEGCGTITKIVVDELDPGQTFGDLWG